MLTQDELNKLFPGQHMVLGPVETIKLPKPTRWGRIRGAIFRFLVRKAARLRKVSELQIIAEISAKK